MSVVSGVEMKFYERWLQALPFSSTAPRGFAARSRFLARLTSLAQIGELARRLEELKNSELKFWLKCRGDTGKGLKTKAELVKRVYEYIRSGKDKHIIDPDPHKIYSRRKQKQGTSSDLVKESTAAAEFPTTVWGTF